MSRKRNRHYEDILEQGKALIKFYMENPCIAAYDLLGVDLAPIQRVVFQDMWFKDYVIVEFPVFRARTWTKKKELLIMNYTI